MARDSYIPLDESLITSEVCIRCGDCCISQQLDSRGLGKKFVGFTYEESEYFRNTISDTNLNFTGVKTFKCPKLTTNEEGFKVCGIYSNRPSPCKSYNCFERANLLKVKPEPSRWKKVTEAIQHVHGIKIRGRSPGSKTLLTI
tara:strand:+ start:929 stop:1357 length:429 start_codon:yes stop_codon:yes gene_type:complete